MQILIADDSSMIRTVIKRTIAQFGNIDCDDAEDGQEAIEMVKSRTYDMIFLDWNMPAYNGLEVLKVARAEGQTCPIVMQTTEADRKKVLLAIAAGVTDYLLKPFHRNELTEKLQKYLPVSS